MAKRTGKEDFIHERTQQLLTRWADIVVTTGKMPVTPGGQDKDRGKVYYDYALSKGWVRKDGADLTAVGYTQAARFLRR